MVAGYVASNVQRNVEIPGGVRVYFKRTGTTLFSSLGDISDVTATPVAEFFDFFSAYDGKSALAKKILQNRAISIEATLNEINSSNLQYAFQASSEVTDSINIPSDSTPAVTSSNTLVLPEAGSDINSILEVRSEDGETLYVVTTDYTVSGDTISIVTSSSLDNDTVEGDKVHVLYDVVFGNATTRSMGILEDTSIEGIVQFHIRNQDGGLAQILQLDSALIAPTGPIAYPVDANQSVPLTITGQIVNGAFGKIYIKDIA